MASRAGPAMSGSGCATDPARRSRRRSVAGSSCRASQSRAGVGRVGGGDDGAQFGGRGHAGDHGATPRAGPAQRPGPPASDRPAPRPDAGGARQGRGRVAPDRAAGPRRSTNSRPSAKTDEAWTSTPSAASSASTPVRCGALVQHVAGQLDHVGLEAPRQQGRAVLDRGAEADPLEQAAILQRRADGPTGRDPRHRPDRRRWTPAGRRRAAGPDAPASAARAPRSGRRRRRSAWCGR